MRIKAYDIREGDEIKGPHGYGVVTNIKKERHRFGINITFELNPGGSWIIFSSKEEVIVRRRRVLGSSA